MKVFQFMNIRNGSNFLYLLPKNTANQFTIVFGYKEIFSFTIEIGGLQWARSKCLYRVKPRCKFKSGIDKIVLKRYIIITNNPVPIRKDNDGFFVLRLC